MTEMFTIQVKEPAKGRWGVVSLRCPVCRKEGSFDRPGDIDDTRQVNGGTWIGLRRCPNPECCTVVTVICSLANKVIASYPPSVLDFDPTGIPEIVKSAMMEAIACHAHGCYVASAMLVRKTLETICSDRQASGKDLQERIKNLGSKIVIPKELLDAMDELRLLGNDAAHVESKQYDKVEKLEVEIAIDLAKEILKGVYQYQTLLDQLRSLKK